MASFVVYTEDGRESINSQKVPLVATSKRIVRPTTNSSNVYTYRFPLYKDQSILGDRTYLYPYKIPYNNVDEELNSLIFVRPMGSGNGVIVDTPYSNTDYIAYFTFADTGNPEKGLEVVLTDLNGVVRDARYITCYADSPDRQPTWSLDTYRYSVSIVQKTFINSSDVYSFKIPEGEKKEEYFVSVPLQAVWNDDNGTSSYYESSDFNVQEVNGTIYYRVLRQVVDNLSNPREPVYVFVAKIKNFASVQGS